MLLLTMLFGCEVAPRHVYETSEVDAFLLRGAVASACVGLENRTDDTLRAYTAERLLERGQDRTANDCLCNALIREDEHRADFAILGALEGSRRNDLARCAAAGMEDAELPEKDRLANGVARLDADAGYQALGQVATGAGALPLRLAAIQGMRHGPGTKKPLLTLLEAEEPELRAAAATSLTGRSGRDLEKAARDLLADDPALEVRAAALGLLVGTEAAGAQRTVCKVLMEDPEATMRIGAAKAFHGSRERGAIDCLKRRLLEDEGNPAVRTTAMDALGASPSDRAAEALCDLIGPMMKSYVKDRIAEETEGVDIARHQNDRDHERSYACVEQALRTPGLSCYARNHLGRWMNDLGGKAARPWCPGMERR